MLVASRTQTLSQDLARILDRILAVARVPTKWAEEEVRQAQTRLEKLEELESEVWMLILRLEGRAAQRRRVERWEDWMCRQRERIRKIQDRVWESRPDGIGHETDRGYRRSSGHLEKVKLPSFSGRQEDFSPFKSQFRELCKGEGYTPILEMAQLRLKLPREALSAITGIQCLEQAWTRLEEIYGNREMSILSTMKSLRDFRTTKQAAHEQLIELAMAVQKCQTELANISATHEFLGDREAIACVIQALPPTIRDKWYDCEVPSDTRKKGEFLVAWIERQREKRSVSVSIPWPQSCAESHRLQPSRSPLQTLLTRDCNHSRSTPWMPREPAAKHRQAARERSSRRETRCELPRRRQDDRREKKDEFNRQEAG